MAPKAKTSASIDIEEIFEQARSAARDEVQAGLLALADAIYATYSATPQATDDVPAEVGEVEADLPLVEADEVDAEDIDAEREALMKESIGTIRKMLIAAEFDPEEIKAEKDKAALVDAYLADKYDDEDEDSEDEEDDEDDSDEEEFEDSDEDDEDDDDEDEDSEDDEDEDGEAYTEDELSEMNLAELKEIAEEMGVEVKKNSRSKTYIAAILAAQEEDEDDEEDDEDEEVDEDEEYDEDAEIAALEAMTLAELKKEARENYGVSQKDLKGLDKEGILALILDEDEDDDDE